jgi:hypothetical protein
MQHCRQQQQPLLGDQRYCWHSVMLCTVPSMLVAASSTASDETSLNNDGVNTGSRTYIALMVSSASGICSSSVAIGCNNDAGSDGSCKSQD